MTIGAVHSAAGGIAAGLWSLAATAGDVGGSGLERAGGAAPRDSSVQLADLPGAGGVRAVGVTQVTGDPAVVQDPTSPPDVRGYATRPAVDLASQMTQTLLAQRSVQANLATLRTADEAYRDVVRLGVRPVEGV